MEKTSAVMVECPQTQGPKSVALRAVTSHGHSAGYGNNLPSRMGTCDCHWGVSKNRVFTQLKIMATCPPVN